MKNIRKKVCKNRKTRNKVFLFTIEYTRDETQIFESKIDKRSTQF